MCWIIVTPEMQAAQEKARNEQFQRMIEEAQKKVEARKAWEACKCPHCGRNDPLPPWLY